MKVKGTLPKGEANGLGEIARALVDDPAAQHVIIALVDCEKYTVNTETGLREATMRILRCEAVTHPDDAAVIQKLMKRLAEERGVQPAIVGIDRAAGLERDDADEPSW